MTDPFDQRGPSDPFEGGQDNPFLSPRAEDVRSSEFVTRSDELLNPWTSMWLQPRATVRQQLETDPTGHVLLLAIVAGVSGQLENAGNVDSAGMASRLGWLAAFAVGGAIGGIVWLYVGGWLVGMTGRALKGVGRARDVRTALAWSNIPTVWLFPLSLALAVYGAVVGPEQTVSAMFDPEAMGNGFDFSALSPLALFLIIIGVIMGIWQFVITCMAVGEAHQISGLGGFGALVLAVLAVMGLAMVVMFLGLAISAALL